MPANATSNRPTAAVSLTDSSCREQSSPAQGEAFRSALDSVGRGANNRVSQEHQQRETQREASLQDTRAEERREERTTRRDETAEGRREERLSARRADERASRCNDDAASRRAEEAVSRRADEKRSRRADQAQTEQTSHGSLEGEEQAQIEAAQQEASTIKDHEIAESSGGGGGSDSPVSEFAEAGGSGRGALNQSTALNGTMNQKPVGDSELNTSGRSGKAMAQPPLQPGIVDALENATRALGKAGGVSITHPTSGEAQSDLALGSAQAASADLDLEAMGQDSALLPQESAASDELQQITGKLERSLGKGVSEPTLRAGGGGDTSTPQTQATGARSVEAGSRGLANNATRAGLDGSQQPSPTADPYNEPEPLPGSVRLRGVRGARINVPTEDGQLISARLDVRDDQVDVRLSAPEGSSRLAEQRASELRQALSGHGMELGEFDVSTSDGQRSETESSGERRESSSGDRNSTSPDTEVDRWGRPIGTETVRGSAADGRGALLDLRL